QHQHRYVCWLFFVGNGACVVALLKRHTEYSGLEENAAHVKWFWQVLEEFSQDDRRRFIKFAWAQVRLSFGCLFVFIHSRFITTGAITVERRGVPTRRSPNSHAAQGARRKRHRKSR